MHLADDYKQEDDIIRLTVKPATNKELVETLTYEVLPIKSNKGEIKMSWVYLSVAFTFESM